MNIDDTNSGDSISESKDEDDDIFNDSDDSDVLMFGGANPPLLKYLLLNYPEFKQMEKMRKDKFQPGQSRQRRNVGNSVIWQNQYPMSLSPEQFSAIQSEFRNVYRKEKKTLKLIDSCSRNQHVSVGSIDNVRATCISLLYDGRNYICPYSNELLTILRNQLQDSDIPPAIFDDIQKKIDGGT